MKKKDWRYEIKYVLRYEDFPAILGMISQHPASFKKAFPDRTINNIYYDTPDFAFCRENLSGIAQRRKIRLRWYGEAEKIVKPVVEEKIKNNSLGRKVNHKLGDTYSETEIHKWVNEHLLKQGTVQPALQNQYVRSYFIDMSGQFRLTIDRGIRYQSAFSRPFTNREYAFTDKRIILELKFTAKAMKYESQITKFIPFRPSKHSKYVTGVLSVFD